MKNGNVEKPKYSVHLFAGGGGGILADLLEGITPVCAVEIMEYQRTVLGLRFPGLPIWDDVRTFDGKPWRGKIDCICGGFPCQDISAAGKGAGIDGARSGLWSEFARIIGEIRPRYAFLENSPMLTVRGLGRVLGDLSALGYDAKWFVMGADDVGAPHRRKRIWILAHADTPCERREQTTSKQQSSPSPKSQVWSEGAFRVLLDSEKLQYAVHSDDDRMADGIPDFVDRSRAIGNGQVPLVAATAFNILKREFE